MAYSWRILCLLALCFCSPAQATSLRYLDLQQLVDASEVVVRGRAVHKESFWHEHRILTRVRIAVDEVWVGRMPTSGELDVLTLGGVVGDIGQRVDGAAVMPVGRELVVQLARGADQNLWPVALSQGVWLLTPQNMPAAQTAEQSVLEVTRSNTDRLVAGKHAPAGPMPTTVQALKAAILEAAHGR